MTFATIPSSLRRVCALLDRADVVRPQNVFEPAPWHAVLDTGRSLIARATGGDWPGTLGLRMAAYARAGGYDGDVLFENLELVRTLRATGAREERRRRRVRRSAPAFGAPTISTSACARPTTSSPGPRGWRRSWRSHRP